MEIIKNKKYKFYWIFFRFSNTELFFLTQFLITHTLIIQSLLPFLNLK